MRVRLRLRRQSRRVSGESGQALVEFAIVAPLIVMVLLFAIWFYELIFVRLKAQEAARYAAWEATAYPLHDYAKGPSELTKLATSMTTAIMTDTMARYSDLDSAKNSITTLSPKHTLLAAEWVQPIVIVTNSSEEQVPGGWMPNLLFSIAGNLFDWLSALNYKNNSAVALALIGAGKAGQGHALTSRMFGNAQWGFNSRGYVEARVAVNVKNRFFQRGVGRFFVDQKTERLMIWEKHGVLADSWRLDDGASVSGNDIRPGNAKAAFGKQIERMYLMNSAARSAIKPFITELWVAGTAALNSVFSPASSITKDDFTRPVVVSTSFGDSTRHGKARISQDRPKAFFEYDTAPATSTAGSNELNEYGKTLQNRGRYFMGCKREMSLGCPSSTLQQDNPFGSYVARE